MLLLCLHDLSQRGRGVKGMACVVLAMKLEGVPIFFKYGFRELASEVINLLLRK